jgi:hypothetical protein
MAKKKIVKSKQKQKQKQTQKQSIHIHLGKSSKSKSTASSNQPAKAVQPVIVSPIVQATLPATPISDFARLENKIAELTATHRSMPVRQVRIEPKVTTFEEPTKPETISKDDIRKNLFESETIKSKINENRIAYPSYYDTSIATPSSSAFYTAPSSEMSDYATPVEPVSIRVVKPILAKTPQQLEEERLARNARNYYNVPSSEISDMDTPTEPLSIRRGRPIVAKTPQQLEEERLAKNAKARERYAQKKKENPK